MVAALLVAASVFTVCVLVPAAAVRWPLVVAAGVAVVLIELLVSLRPPTSEAIVLPPTAKLAVQESSPAPGPSSQTPPCMPVREEPALPGGPPAPFTTIRLTRQVVRAQKLGAPPEEYEDAFAFAETSGVLAVSDGAASAFEARRWANALTRAFVDHTPPNPSLPAMRSWLQPLAASFDGDGPAVHDDWYVEAAAEKGSAATLLGLVFHEDGRYTAVAVGDTCVVHLRPGGPRWTVVQRFPLHRSEQFGRNPSLVSSRLDDLDVSLADLRAVEGRWYWRDVFIVATDAVAQWAYEQEERERAVWDRLLSIPPDQANALFTAEREAGHMTNDDVTMVAIQVGAPRSPA
jgi:hypothetical protein